MILYRIKDTSIEHGIIVGFTPGNPSGKSIFRVQWASGEITETKATDRVWASEEEALSNLHQC